MGDDGLSQATKLMGFLVGFLIVGVIGIYIGDQMLASSSLNESDALYSSQAAVIETFQLGVTFAKVLVIVCVAGLVFLVLQKTGLVPGFGSKGGEF